MKLGGWSYDPDVDFLGQGGNGKVYRAVSSKCVTGALKRLHRNASQQRRQRFDDEIAAMRACSNIGGCLRVLDSYPPGAPEGQWFVMVLAEPFTDALGKEPPLRAVVEAVRDIAQALTEMHRRGYAHRDLKPDNLFKFEGRWAVGDFGLVDFEGKSAETKKGERIGPVHYIAPEMLLAASTSDGSMADVYSLAKVLWVTATGQNYPLPGSHDATVEAFRIGRYINSSGASLLDAVVVASTAIEPHRRPKMDEFANELNLWLNPFSMRTHTPISLDFGAASHVLADHKARIDIAAQQLANLSSAQAEIGDRIRERFRTLGVQIRDSLQPQPFTQPVDLSIDSRQGFRVYAAVHESDNQVTEMEIDINVETFELPNVVLSGHINVERRGAITTRVQVWQDRRTFIAGGPSEAATADDLEAGLRAHLQPAVDVFRDWVAGGGGKR